MQQRGQIIPRGDRTYLLRVYLGRVAGKRKYHNETLHGTISQAKQRLTQLQRGQDTQTLIAPSKQRLADYLPAWLAAKQDIGEAARAVYAHHFTKHILPALGMLPLAGITPVHIRSFYGSLISDHELSPRTVRLTHTILRGALQQAVEDGMLATNPCDKARKALPKKPQNGSGAALSMEDTILLIDRTDGTRYGAFIRLMLTTGLRPQEVFALKWADLEQQDGTWMLHVRRVLKPIGHGNVALSDEMKTAASRRRITLSEKTVQALQEHRQEQLKEILKRGAGYVRNDFIFAGKDGKYLTLYTGRYQWKKALLLAGLPTSYRLYDARHTHLTHALSVAHPKAVADRSGHSNPNVLLNTYAHTLPSVAKGAPEAIEERLHDARRSTVQDSARDAVGSGLVRR